MLGIDKLVLLVKFSQLVDVGSFDCISKYIFTADTKTVIKIFL